MREREGDREREREKDARGADPKPLERKKETERERERERANKIDSRPHYLLSTSPSAQVMPKVELRPKPYRVGPPSYK